MGSQQSQGVMSTQDHSAFPKVADVPVHVDKSQDVMATTQRHNSLCQAVDILVDVDVNIINKCSGRKLYAAENANWDNKLGAGCPPSAVDADGHWRITKDGDGFRIVNQYSHRSLYAKQGRNWEEGVGAGSPPSAVHADGVWYITPEDDGFRIINKHSQRCLYAADSKNWEEKVGAGSPVSAVHADGIWYITPARMPARPPRRKGLSEVHFPMMTESEAAELTLDFNDSTDFADRLRRILGEQGVAIVTGVVSREECGELEQIWSREVQQQTPLPQEHAQGELAWRARLHPNVKDVFASIFSVTTDDLSVGMDKVFFTPNGASPSDVNHQWLHVDQNYHTGLKHLCYQGVLYVRPSGPASSTTAAWPGSHRDKVYQQRIMAAAESNTGRQFVPLNEISDFDLRREAVDLTRRVPVPCGALLLWDSRAVHQGWHGGPRLAVPICWEPRERVDAQARKRKLYFSAVGAPTSHSPSEGRLHPNVNEHRIHKLPEVRPYSVLPVDALDDEQWCSLWSDGNPSEDSLVRMLRPEIAAVL